MQEEKTNPALGIYLRVYAWWLVKVILREGRKRVREKESKIKNQRRDVQGDRRSKGEPVERESG